MQKANLTKLMCAGAVALGLPLGLIAQTARSTTDNEEIVRLEEYVVTEMKAFSD